mmetsp:Transcript_42395/g.55898  ORF Transcript_42395/g.55898 Transcript_42395/m.55898 type:complete len:182 (-) Transcript_42395:870-1415(-)
MMMIPDKQKKTTRMAAITENPNSSQSNKAGQFQRMLQGLQPVSEENRNGNDYLSSSTNSHDIIQNAKQTIRKNSNVGRDEEMMRRSKMGSVANLEAIDENPSREHSRIQASNELDTSDDRLAANNNNDGGKNNQAMANIFAATANQRQRDPEPPQQAAQLNPLDSLFAATAAQQQKKKRGF